MVEFNIQGFEPQYDAKEKIGWLCKYYPHDAVKSGEIDLDVWRNETYSPKILDFKEGRDADIQFFIEPMIQLIDEICKTEAIEENVLLIPVPSSLPKLHPEFKDTPRRKGEKRNRDDRNEVFCKMISCSKSNWSTIPLLARIKEKQPKQQWTVDQQFNSLKFDERCRGLLLQTPCFLVDDVTTKHHTFQGAKRRILEEEPTSKVFCVAIGHTTAP